jgi:hypothetical protein
LGDEQRNWLKGVLAASKAANKPWQVLGNQVLMGRVMGPDVTKIAAAVPPPRSLREADNALIAAATCRDSWPPIIEASGNDRGTFLLPGFGEVLGGARLRSLRNLLPDEPVRWRRLKFLSSRDEKLGVSIGRLENCDDPKSTQTYITVWVRDGKSWRLELLAVTPGGS